MILRIKNTEITPILVNNESHFGSQWAILKSNPSLVTNMSDSSLTSWTEGGGRAMATPMNPMTDEGEWPDPPVRWLKWLWLTGGGPPDFLEPPDPPPVWLLLLLWLGTWGLSLPRSSTTRYPDDWKVQQQKNIVIPICLLACVHGQNMIKLTA